MISLQTLITDKTFSCQELEAAFLKINSLYGPDVLRFLNLIKDLQKTYKINETDRVFYLEVSFTSKVMTTVRVQFLTDGGIIRYRTLASEHQKFHLEIMEKFFFKLLQFLYKEETVVDVYSHLESKFDSLNAVPISNSITSNITVSRTTASTYAPTLSTSNSCERKDKKMNKMFNFDFGALNDDSVKLSMYGLAVKGAEGAYVAYDKTDDAIKNVDIMSFDLKNMVYKMPTALKDIKTGDMILHNKELMYVKDINETNFVCISPGCGELKIILPTKSIFGFDFVTKVVSLIDMTGAKASAANPFGNMLPFLLMNDKSHGSNNMLPLLFMMQGNSNFKMDNNMLMVAAAMGEKDLDPMALMLLMNAETQSHSPLDRTPRR